ncbi:HD domain-containing protein [Candidatus Wolfebacteria bacterium]|nr:HD domain-containing protein [Candidatus Wolfebacteria bacterium]
MPKNTQKIKIFEEVRLVSDTLQNAGFEAYLVGGCVRDLLRGEKPKDWDITTNARPEQIQGLFEHAFYENEFGTVGVVNDNTNDPTLKTIEVTTYRLESTYSDSRHPDNVSFSSKLEDDLKRRDFTINAVALGLPVGAKDIDGFSTEKDSPKGHLVDLFGGIKDIKDKTIRTVGRPEDRFGEDALRILRAVRLATELGFTVSRETGEAIKKMAQNIDAVAKERVRDEFVKIIMSDNPKSGLELAHELGLLHYILPEIEWGIGVEQNQAHSYTVWEHGLRTLQATADKKWELEVRLAALFHDSAKPKARAWEDKKNDWSFHGHEVAGARIAKTALQRLKFASAVIDKVYKLVRWHMFFSDTEQITHSAVRRLMRNVGYENVSDLMNLRVADRIGTGRPKEKPYRFRKYQAMIEEVSRDPVSVGMLKIDGSRIMEVTHETPGPRVGWILHALLEEILDDPANNTPEYLEKRTLELIKLSDNELRKLGKAGEERREEEEEKEVKKIRGKHWVE